VLRRYIHSTEAPLLEHVDFSELNQSTSCDKIILFNWCETFLRNVWKAKRSLKPKHFLPNIVPKEATDTLLTQTSLPFTCDPFEGESISECLHKDRS